MATLEVVWLEWVLFLVESRKHPLPTPSTTQMAIAISAFSILSFSAAAGLGSIFWAGAGYVLAICALLLELLLSAFGFLRKLRKPLRARSKEVDGLFAQ